MHNLHVLVKFLLCPGGHQSLDSKYLYQGDLYIDPISSSVARNTNTTLAVYDDIDHTVATHDLSDEQDRTGETILAEEIPQHDGASYCENNTQKFLSLYA